MVDDATTPSAAEPRRSAARLGALRRVRNEGLLLALATGVVALSAFLVPTDGSLAVFGWTVPPLCVWKNLTGMDCLGCGLTRSFVWMGHGDLRAAFGLHAMGPPLFVAVALQVPLRLWRVWQARDLLRER